MSDAFDNHAGPNAASFLQVPQHQWAVFLAQWLMHQRRMCSVAPSGRQLGQLMASALPTDTKRVLELGAGTGAITRALLRCGIEPHSLMAVEMNPVLHRVLQQRFPAIHTTCGDARHLESLMQGCQAFATGHVDAICSNLGLLAMPRALQHDILATAFRVLRRDGVFVQYTYGLKHPLANSVRDELGLTCSCVGTSWLNLPPARVYVYTRDEPLLQAP